MYYNFGDGYYSQELKKRQFEEGKQLFDRAEYAAAVALFRRAATDCYQSAECYLGYCHSHGLGVERNLFEALRWYRFQDRYVSWVGRDVAAIRAEIEASGAADSREPVIFTDDKLGEIRVIFLPMSTILRCDLMLGILVLRCTPPNLMMLPLRLSARRL